MPSACYEAGRRFADADFARTSWDVRRYLWAPALKCFGVQRIHRLRDVMILAGAGVGGGSLNYANTLYVPPPAFFEDPQWAHITDWQAELAPHYETASRMLGVVTNPCDGPVEQVMRAAATELGVEATLPADSGRGVLRRAGGSACRPVLRRRRARTHRLHRVRQLHGRLPGRRQEHAGEELPGARRAARRDDRADAHRRRHPPARPEPSRGRVCRDDPRERCVGCGATGRPSPPARWCIAAGAWGTANLLQRLKTTSLPRLSDALGDLTRTNSEALGGAQLVQVPGGVDLTRGVAITTSFHVDEETHVENCRYGTGSNLMGLLATAHGRGRGPGAAPAAVRGGSGAPPRRLRAHPVGAALVANAPSSRSSCNPVDNSLTVRGRRGRLGRVRADLAAGPRRAQPDLVPPGQHGRPGAVRAR